MIAGLSGTALAQTLPELEFKSRELQEGRSYTKLLISALAAGQSSGQATYGYRIDVPQARGVTPDITLSYRSGGGASELGWGWSLSLPSIERSSAHGVPTYTSADIFEFHRGDSTVRLVPAGPIASDGSGDYREESERTFSRYTFSGNSWTVLPTNGLSYRLGDDPSNRRGRNTSAVSGTAAWLIHTISDTHSNYAAYSYAADPAGNAQIAHVYYGGNLDQGLQPPYRVDFQWTPFWSYVAPVSYRSGYRRTFGAQKLTTIVVHAPAYATTGPAKVPSSSPESRTYTVSYGSSDIAGDNNGFYLRSIAVGGEPAQEFTYEEPWPTSPDPLDTQVVYNGTSSDGQKLPGDLGRVDDINNGDGAYEATRRVLVDVTGDGRPDIVDAGAPCGTQAWSVWRNTGGGFARETWSISNASGVPDSCAVRAEVWTATFPFQGHALPQGVVQDFLDVNGDSYPDLVYLNSDQATVVCPGNGHGFDSCSVWPGLTGGLRHEQLSFTKDPNNALAIAVSTDEDMVDFNGDGLVDRVKVVPGAVAVASVSLNSGAHTWLPPFTTGLPPCFPALNVSSCLRLSANVATSDPLNDALAYAELRDVNGDGLPDFVTFTDTSGGSMVVYWGTGYGFDGTPTILSSAVGAGPGLPGHVGAGNFVAGDSNTHAYTALGDLVDVNNDGLPDWVEMPNVETHTFSVRYNYGGVWDPNPRTYVLSDDVFNVGQEYTAPSLSRVGSDLSGRWTRGGLIDMDRDGIPDFVSAPRTGNGALLVRHLSFRAGRAMIRAQSLSHNHAMEVTYSSYSAPTSGDSIPFPITVATVTKRQRTPLYTGEWDGYTQLTTNSIYQNAVYDRPRRELMGFATVISDDEGDGRYEQTNYFTDPSRDGLVQWHYVGNTAAASAPNAESYDYSVIGETPGSYWPRLDKQHVQVGYAREKTTTYTEYGGYGNPTKWTEDGWVDDASDDVHHTRGYAVRDDSDRRLVLPALDVTTNAAAKTVSVTGRYYDNRLIFGATPSKGELVRVDRAVDASAGTNVTTQSYFDGYGNVTDDADAEGYTTTYGYDGTYHQFRVSAANTLGTTYKSYHPLTGQVADACGPQHVGDSWNCSRVEIDAIGRPIKTYSSVLSSGAYSFDLRKSYAYSDYVYPLQMIVTSFPGAGASSSTAVELLDGFGSPVEVRSQETPETIHVYETTYDPFGMPARDELPRRETTDTLYKYTHAGPSLQAYAYQYDRVRGAIEKIVEPQGFHGTPTVTRVTTATSAEARVTSTNEDGSTTIHTVDAFGRAQKVRKVGGAAGDAITSYTYDANGFLTVVQDPNQLATTYVRNSLGWITATIAPDGSTSTTTYNNRGQVKHTTDARGVNVTYNRDAAGRLIERISDSEPANVRHVDETYTYYGDDDTSQLGWQKDESDSGAVLHRTYDPAGRVKTQALSHGQDGLSNTQAQVTFDYLPGGRLNTLSYPDGWQIKYNYKLDDAVSSVTVPATGFVLAAYGYEDDGQPSYIENDAGLSESYDYDIRGRMIDVASTNTALLGADLVDDQITWSNAHRIDRIDRRGLNTDGKPRATPDVFIMNHDGLNRLTNVTKNGAAFAAYSYDVGGRLLQHDVSTSPQTTIYQADKLTSRTFDTNAYTYDYDNAGDVIQDRLTVGGSQTRRTTHYWDAIGRYTETSRWKVPGTTDDTRYWYLPSGLVRVDNPTETFVNSRNYYIGNWARQSTSTGAWTDSVVVNGRVVVESTGGKLEMPHRTYDQTVLAISDGQGKIVRQEEFAPYGRRTGGTAAGGFEQHFQGLRADDLVIAGARVYDPARGAWLSRDPLPLDAPERTVGVPTLANLYGFNNGDPVSYRDPSGHCPVCFGAVLLAFEIGVMEPELEAGAMEVEGGVQAVAEGVAPLVEGATQAIESAGPAIEGGVQELAEGGGELVEGTEQMAEGGGELVEGTEQMAESAGPAIDSGAQAVENANANPYGNLSRAEEFGIKPYSELKNDLTGSELEAHHLFEKRFADTLGEDPDDMLSVAVTRGEHNAFTQAWRGEIGYNNQVTTMDITTSTATVDDIRQAAAGIYTDYPAIKDTLGL